MGKTWRDPSFVYHNEASHANGNNFRKRMQKRMREARELREADARVDKIFPLVQLPGVRYARKT